MTGEPICTQCDHFIIHKKKNICKAFPKETKKFPKGIPWEIISGKNDHSKPFPGQGNDIIFKPKED